MSSSTLERFAGRGRRDEGAGKQEQQGAAGVRSFRPARFTGQEREKDRERDKENENEKELFGPSLEGSSLLVSVPHRAFLPTGGTDYWC